MVRRTLLAFACLISLLLPRDFAHADDSENTSILNGSVAVQAMGYVAYPVTVDLDQMTEPTIVGHVEASGGSGNDIIAAVVTASDFLNFKNNHTTHPLYNSGQVTAADLNVRLTESGTYYVLLSNTFSGVTPKTVEGSLQLTWTPSVEAVTQNSVLAGGGLFILLAILAITGAVGGLIVWLVMSRKKKQVTA